MGVTGEQQETHAHKGLGKIAAALAKAQGEIDIAVKDRVNPHFKAPYATLASVWRACRAALSKNEIAVIQIPSAEGATVTVRTRLIHSSGEEISGEFRAQARSIDIQAIGSIVTYLCRYSLMAYLGIPPDEEDDDGEAAVRPTPKPAFVAEKDIPFSAVVPHVPLPAPQRVQPIFDLNNKAHLDALENALINKYKITDQDVQDKIAVALKGRPTTDVPAVIKELGVALQ